LQELSQSLNHGKTRHAFPFDPTLCLAPLPRASQWVSLAAFARPGAPDPDPADPPLRRQAGDAFFGPCDEIEPSDDTATDFEAGIAVATGDVGRGASPEEALEGIRLLMLAGDLNRVDPSGHTAHWASAFSPVALTPDELGAAWQGGRVHLNLESTWNGKRVGLCAGADMRLHFGQLIACLARARDVRAGSLVGSGPVSSADGSRGFSAIADKRALETLADGEARSAFMARGDTLRIEMKGADGLSLFGAIDLRLAAAPSASPAGGAPTGDSPP
jgi:fumarylacetoacetate (FAA) hydrolase